MNPEHVHHMALVLQRVEHAHRHNPQWEHHAALAAARPARPSRVAVLLRRLRMGRRRPAASAVAATR